MKVGIIEYPGSNCSKDAGEYFKNHNVTYI
jgi:hypothetical protein